ncbi:MAG: histone deacetylase [Gammaproteobacteria bacterium]|nr:histone deacetylase [Gammaproteobacteria bacterium]MBI5616134.1 histone deacetylase [Gammaproteobacteria bacterium]
MATGLVYDPRYLEHDTGPGHPERPGRLIAARRYLEHCPWTFTAMRPVEADLQWVEYAHPLTYIRRAAAACAAGDPFFDSMDVAICQSSYHVALLAVGGALALGDALVDGRIHNGFALARPPGHHAEPEQALGFCVFNNIAILARYLQRRHGLGKVAIVDWDVHHGNGTQHIFEEDPSVLYISTHQYPYYPGTGSASETGIGAGAGATLNVPMPAGATDSAYERAFMESIIPKLDLFKPDVVLISAGFDAHRDDPLGDVQLSTSCFAWMTERLVEIADHYAGGRLISLLEGGYHLERLAECVAAHTEVLCNFPRS